MYSATPAASVDAFQERLAAVKPAATAVKPPGMEGAVVSVDTDDTDSGATAPPQAVHARAASRGKSSKVFICNMAILHSSYDPTLFQGSAKAPGKFMCVLMATISTQSMM